MKNSLQITAAIDHPGLLEDKVEQLAYVHREAGYCQQELIGNNEAIETSTAEVYANGIVAMNNSTEQVNMPFIACFVFTCIKRKGRNFRIEWSSSLT